MRAEIRGTAMIPAGAGPAVAQIDRQLDRQTDRQNRDEADKSPGGYREAGDRTDFSSTFCVLDLGLFCVFIF